MSEKAFKEAKSDLAFSQRLRDELFAQQQQPQGAPVEEETTPKSPVEPENGSETAPERPQEEPMQEEVAEEKGIVESVIEAIKPMFDDIKEMFTKKEEEPKEVELKIGAEMAPKEGETEK